MDTHTRVLGMLPWVQNSFAYQLLASARFFLDDADALGSRGSAGQFFLYFQSIELSLKSYLALRGYDKRELLDLGHNLERILVESEKNGLEELPNEQRLVLVALNKGNEFAALRYVFEFELPGLSLTQALAKTTLKTSGKYQRSKAAIAEDEKGAKR
jgi:hypothetical protein